MARKRKQQREERRSKPIPKAAQRAVSRATKDNKVSKSERRDIRQAVRSSGGSRRQAKSAVKTAKKSVKAAVNDFRSNDIGKFARTADTYGMGTADQGVFSGASWNQAKAAGFTDQQIRDYLAGGNTGLMIGGRVQNTLDNWDSMTSPAPDMPAGYDPRGEGKEIAPSTASRPDVFFSPVNLEGINNMWGNPLSNQINSSVVGDGMNWQDPANAGELAKYYTPEARMNMLNGMYAMSTANPNLGKNMAAFIDSGHRESLLTGKAPSADPSGWNNKYPAAMGTASTPWSQAYANQLSYKSPWMK